MLLGTSVAKKKPISKPADPKAKPADRVDFVRVRVSGAYKDWLGKFADSERSDMSDLIDDALALLAKTKGFEGPPKR